jgi:hypothetical protein
VGVRPATAEKDKKESPPKELAGIPDVIDSGDLRSFFNVSLAGSGNRGPG